MKNFDYFKETYAALKQLVYRFYFTPPKHVGDSIKNDPGVLEFIVNKLLEPIKVIYRQAGSDMATFLERSPRELIIWPGENQSPELKTTLIAPKSKLPNGTWEFYTEQLISR